MSLSKNAIATLAAAGLLTVGAGTTVALAAGNGDGLPSTTYGYGHAANNGSTSGNQQGDGDGPGGGRGHGHGRGGMGMGADLSTLATKLGVSEDKLKTALQGVRSDMRNNAQGNQNQTREQREAAMAKALATKLGISESKVTSALTQLRSEAASKRATELKTQLDAQVKAGKLTQAEADAILSAVKKGAIDAHVPGMGRDGDKGGRMGGGMGMGGPDGQRGNGNGNGSAANGGTTSSSVQQGSFNAI